jgi:hypothetical protein
LLNISSVFPGDFLQFFIFSDGEDQSFALHFLSCLPTEALTSRSEHPLFSNHISSIPSLSNNALHHILLLFTRITTISYVDSLVPFILSNFTRKCNFHDIIHFSLLQHLMSTCSIPELEPFANAAPILIASLSSRCRDVRLRAI